MFKFLKNIFSNKKLSSSVVIPDYSSIDMDKVYNVDNFNTWFNDPNNGAVYAHAGIFLRRDKLSHSHFFDYFESYDGIIDGEDFAYNNITDRIYDFEKLVQKDWRQKQLTK